MAAKSHSTALQLAFHTVGMRRMRNVFFTIQMALVPLHVEMSILHGGAYANEDIT